MKPPEVTPEEAMLAAVVGAGVGLSAVRIWTGQPPLTDAARRHPWLAGYVFAHLVGWLPWWLDVFSIAGRVIPSRVRDAVAEALP